MNFWYRIIAFPILGAVVFHILGACFAGIFIVFLHYRHNFNSNPEMIAEYWEKIIMIAQLPALAAFFFGIILAIIYKKE